MSRRASGDRGETLIELIVAVTIMGGAGVVLASGLFTSGLSGNLQRSAVTARQQLTDAAELVPALTLTTCDPAAYESALHEAGAATAVSVDRVRSWVPAESSFAACAPDSPVRRIDLTVRPTRGGPQHLSVAASAVPTAVPTTVPAVP